MDTHLRRAAEGGADRALMLDAYEALKVAVLPKPFRVVQLERALASALEG